MEKKKEAGKAPRNSQAGANKFNTPIPKIQGAGAVLSGIASESESAPTTTGNTGSETQEITPVTGINIRNASESAGTPTVTVTSDHAAETQEIAPANCHGFPTHELPMFEPPASHVPTGEAINNDSEEVALIHTSHWHPGLELPPLDLELFNAALENEPIPEPTAAEKAAHLFLRGLFGNH